MRPEEKDGFVFNCRNQPIRPDIATFAFCFAVLLTRAMAQESTEEPVNTANPITAELDSGTNRLQAAPVPANEAPLASPLAGTSQLSAMQPPAAYPVSTPGNGPLRWGMLDIRPHLLYQLSYGNGLQFSPGQQGNTFINQVSPGVSLHLRSHLSLDYTPTLRFYSDPRFKDGTDQSVNLVWGTSYQDWTLGFSQAYNSSSQPLVETGSQTDQQSYSTSLNAGYQIGSKASLSFGINQYFRFVAQTISSEALTDTREWSTADWFNYQFAPRLITSAGVGFTYDNMAAGPDMLSEQVQGRIIWHLYNKLQFELSGGLNNQQFVGSHAPDLLSPIFSVSARYQLFETTSLSLTGSRTVSPAYFQGASSEVTGVNAGLRQRLLGRFYLDLGGGYNTTSYNSTTGGQLQTTATDYTRTLFNVGLSTVLLKGVTASASYQIGYGSSTSALYNYTTRQAGLTLGYRF